MTKLLDLLSELTERWIERPRPILEMTRKRIRKRIREIIERI